MTNLEDKLLALIAIRDAQDTLERATGWCVLVTHQVHREILSVYGPWETPAAALEAAQDLEQGLNETPEESGFRTTVHALMPWG